MSKVSVMIDQFPSGNTRVRVGSNDYYVSMTLDEAMALHSLLGHELQDYLERKKYHEACERESKGA